MATTCLIVRKTDDGEYQHILCHHAGQIENGVGDTLLNHYNDAELVAELFDLGDLSSLGKTLNPGDTVAYYRDLGEEWENVVPNDSRSLALIPEEPFVYLFENDGWKYRTEAGGHFRPIPDWKTRRKLAMIKSAREKADQVQERRVIYECGQEVLGRAASCPKCGNPIPEEDTGSTRLVCKGEFVKPMTDKGVCHE